MRFLIFIAFQIFHYVLVGGNGELGISIGTASQIIIANRDCKDDAPSATCGDVCNPDSSTVSFDNSLSNREPHANSPCLTARWFIAGVTIESFEDPLAQDLGTTTPWI